MVETKALANAFSRIIREWLTAEELASVNARNAAETGSVCHSHDYCDANQAMVEALAEFGVEFDADCCEPIDAAWSMAKASGFGDLR